MDDWSTPMRLYQVDAFTDQPFKGNPAGVCVLDAERPDAWLQSVAAEMNLSETAFPRLQGEVYDLRWFTPKREVSLCGHATLATAHILWEEHHVKPEAEIAFDTLSGRLTARREGDWIALDFPTRTVNVAADYPALNQALGIVPQFTFVSAASSRGDTYLLEVASEDIVRQMTPDFTLLAATSARAVIVTARAQGGEYDFCSRFLAPAIGINEDPVTGSAHCYLAPYWGTKLHKTALVGFQASARTGIVGCAWRDARVILQGKAITVFRGELLA
jgi:PhzF family phenazine biosynthesis protein